MTKVHPGTPASFQIKKEIAAKLQVAMKRNKITKMELSRQLNTSRWQIERMLCPEKGNCTINTLERFASHLGLQVKVLLVPHK